MNWKRIWWSITCTIVLWLCVGTAIGVIAGIIFGLWAIGLSGLQIYIGMMVGIFGGLTFWKAWRDYPEYHPHIKSR